MRRLLSLFVACLALLMMALPALAQEDPLAKAVLLPNIVGWALVVLALVLIVLLRLWSSRRPN